MDIYQGMCGDLRYRIIFLKAALGEVIAFGRLRNHMENFMIEILSLKSESAVWDLNGKHCGQ